MSGYEIKNRKKKRGLLLSVPMALEILLALTLLLLFMGIRAYQTQLRGFEEYELKNYREMMELCLDTGVKQIRLESIRALREGEPLDLEVLNDRIGAVEFDPSLIDESRNLKLKWDKLEYSMQADSMYYLYLVLRGDGKTLLIDGSSGQMKELEDEDTLAVNCRKAFLKGEQMSWIPSASENEENGKKTAGGEEESAVYCLAEVIPMEGMVAYGQHTVLFNDIGAGIGMACRVDPAAVRDGCRIRALRTTIVPFGIIWGVVIALCLLVHISMQLLRTMQRTMRRFRNGEDVVLDEKIRAKFLPDRTKPREELTDLAESFYVMAGNLRQYRDDVEGLRERYEPFIPEVLSALFNTEDVLNIRPGDRESISGSSLQFEFKYGESDADKVEDSGRAHFAATAAEIIEGKGGLPIRLGPSGVTAVFREGSAPDEALELIMALKDKTNGPDEILWTKETGDFCVRITGTQERMTFSLEKVTGDRS